ncbi:hypothetical protein Lesp02_13050 [Lentzea sp. NBRC 105346]|uniref:AAA family ATPase n=1 Tax=Lentzea sp. NBRC 105346 TaxID=3032205 RepID=UPI0024A086DD|nr:ATP-binding protein [Lentzea sp. NBRC 105346]GLZ29115.1 hypothetical protein Lesp02_13050 [Lentzea sp. NBRC 105346]
MTRLAWHDQASWAGLLVERDQYRRVVDRAVADMSSVLLVHAPPGGGLTTALELAASTARSRGARVVWARCSPDERTVPSGAASQVLSALSMSFVDDRQRRCRAVLEAARERPLVVVVDDVQWIDPDSASLLVALAMRTSHAPLLLVAGCSAAHPIVAALRDAAARLNEYVLPLLGRDGITRLLAAACPAPVSEKFVDVLVDETRGSPAVVRRVLVALAARSAMPRPQDVPELALGGWQDLVTRAVDALPRPAQRLVRTMAVCHEVFGLRDSAVVAGLGSAYADEADALTAAGLLVGGSLPCCVAASLVLGTTSWEERAELHAAAASLAHRTALPDDVIANLLLGAGPIGEPWVLEVLRNAARGTDDDRARVRLLTRALAEPTASEERAALLVDCGAAEVRHAPDAGERKLVAAGTAAAVELVLARGNTELAYRMVADRDLAALYWLSDDAPHEAPELAGLAPLVPRVGDPADAAITAWQLVTAGRDIGRARKLARAVLAGSPQREPLLLPWVHAARSLSLMGDFGESTAALDAVIIEAGRRGLPVLSGWALLMRAKGFWRQGMLADAAHDLDRATRELPPEHWHPTVRPVFTGLRLVLELEAGRHDEAERISATAEPAGGFQGVHLDFARGLLNLVTGDFTRAATLFEECGRVMLARRWRNPALMSWRSFGAVALHRCGRTEDALRLVREEIRLAEAWGDAGTLGGAHLRAAMIGERPAHHRERAVKASRTARSTLRFTRMVQQATVPLDAGGLVADVRALTEPRWVDALTRPRMARDAAGA